MNEHMTIITERVDDIPLLLAQIEAMGIPLLLDEHFPTHGNWQGLSLGQLTQGWLSCILSEADHRMNQVEPWGLTRLHTLQDGVGSPVRREDLTDDRLAAILDDLGDDAAWETALNQRTIRVYQLGRQRIRIDATTARSYLDVTADGRGQCGHSKEHRPDLPQIKINMAALDPLGMPVMTEVMAGNRAEDPLYLPAIRRVQQSVEGTGLTYIGDRKIGSLETRAAIIASDQAYLCPLSQVQLSPEEVQSWLTPVAQGQQTLR